jgi:hypothetical protein
MKIKLPSYLVSGSRSIGWLVKTANGKTYNFPENTPYDRVIRFAEKLEKLNN